jgi:hypothetical protein
MVFVQTDTESMEMPVTEDAPWKQMFLQDNPRRGGVSQKLTPTPG